MEALPPPSLSVYRGQARSGIGEGPDMPIAHGEQYLRADRRLASDGPLLAAIRPWMSLDSDPADHQRLDNQLEAWSHFSHRELRFVVRLTIAPAYDRRIAYFAHGRAWPLDAEGADVGLHLGRTEAFETPWRDDQPGVRAPEPPPALVRPEQVEEELAMAFLFAAHLHQAMVLGYPLVIAAPVVDFRSGSALHALVGLSRAVLPPDLRAKCRIRVYTRLPDLFLRHHGANLVVVPEDSAADALAGHREAALVDRRGELRAGRALDPAVLAYAEALVERAIHLPEGLAPFGRRLAKRRSGRGLPVPADARNVQISYNLAYAFTGASEELDDLLRRYLPRAAQKQGPGLDWQQLIDDREWELFPRRALLDLALLDSQTLHPGVRELQEAAERALARLGRMVDEGLRDWWNPVDPAKVRRLLELLTRQPPIVSEAAAVELTAGVSLRELGADGPGLVRALLLAELRRERIGMREGELEDLVRLAADPDVFDVLQRAVGAKQLGTGWASALVERMSPGSAAATAARFLAVPSFWDSWGELPQQLLAGLRTLGPALAGFGPMLCEAGKKLDPARHPRAFLLLLDVLAELDRAAASPTTPILVAHLAQALPRIERPADRDLVVNAILAQRPACLEPRLLVAAGRLRASWLKALADRLLAVDEVVERLSTDALLELAKEAVGDGIAGGLQAALDHRMREERESTTDALARSGWWSRWRRGTELRGQERQVASFAWLTSSVWHEHEVEATYESWRLALDDLPAELSSADMETLCGPAPRHFPGPVIPPFEEDQVAALAGRAGDLGALAELADAVRADGRLGEESHWQLVLAHGHHALPAVRAEVLTWLMDLPASSQRPTLTLEESATLCEHAGDRWGRALAARRQSVRHRLRADPWDAIQAADVPSLWDHPPFLRDLAEWMAEQRTLDAIGREMARRIDAQALGEPERRPDNVSGQLVRELVNAGCDNAARLLSTDRYQEVKDDDLTAAVLDALLAGAADRPCWPELARRIRERQAEELPGVPLRRHPLLNLADRIRRDDLSPPDRKVLRETGWDTFEAAARRPENRFMTHDDESLPAFEVAASLLGPGAAGSAALRLVFADAAAYCLSSEAWWRALLRGVGAHRRGPVASADDWDEAALALLRDAADRLAPAVARTFRHADQALRAA